MNIVNCLYRSAQLVPGKPALWFEGRSWTYKELYSKALAVADALTRDGLVGGDRVCLLLPNIPEFVLAYYAIAAAGAIPVSINVMSEVGEISHIVNDSCAHILITSEDLISRVPRRDMSPCLFSVYVVGSCGELPPTFVPFDDLIRGGEPRETWHQLKPSSPASILYTSGTTGSAKGAVLTLGNILSNVASTNHHTKTIHTDVLMCFLPLFHCFGQNFIMNASINAGATLVLHRRFDAEEILASIVVNKVTMFLAVPTVFRRLLQVTNVDARFAGVRMCFSAAAPLSTHIEEEWRQMSGMVINQGYGMTECSPFAAYNHDVAHRTGSVGSPIQNVQMKIVTPDGSEADVGQFGEIVIQGPNVMAGYYRNPADTNMVIRNGWLHTGDLGYRDDQDYFFVVDRLKDMINVAGFKVWPREVEDVLIRHPGINEVAVVGVDSKETGDEVVVAVIVPRGSVQITLEDITQFCAGRIAKYKIPKQVQCVANLPKSPAGKILKRQIRQTLQASQARQKPGAY